MIYNIIIVSIIFLIGISIGSFANVCIYRIPLKESIIFPASHCPSCNNDIKKRDLIPILSYILLKGKCRYCGEKISPQYSIVEFVYGLGFIGLYLKYGYTLEFLFNAVLVSIIIILTLIDIKSMEVPDKIIIFGFVVVLGIILYRVIALNESFLNYLFGFLFGGGIFLIIALITNAMGGGDIKLMALIGSWVGLKYIVTITLLSFVIGAIISILLILFKIKGRKDFIPFVPFIAIATLITIFFGDEIIRTYFTFLF